MTALYVVGDAAAPATGDLRLAGTGDTVYVRPSATSRRDWARYWDALGVAYARGANVVLMRGEET